MAENAVIGALRVVLGADTAAFEDGLKKAQGSANSFASSITKIASGIGLEHGIEKVVEGIVHAFKEAIKHADEMGKMAQKVGISVEELTGLKLAADLADVSMESLSTGLGKLSKNMVEAAGGSKEAKDKFDALGISVRDSSGNLKSNTQVLAELADKFEHSKDGAEKVATAIGLLGKGGKDLIPLLNEGGNSLREFAKVAEQMGLVITKTTADQSQKFNDNLKILKLASEGLANQIIAQLLPALVNLSNGFANTAKDGTLAKNVADTITQAIIRFVIASSQAVVTTEFLIDAFKKFGDTRDKVGKGEASLDELKGSLGNILETIKAIDQWTAIYDGKSGFQQPTDQVAELNKRLTDTKAKILDLLRAPTEVHVTKPALDTADQAFKLGQAIEDLRFKTAIARHEFDALSVGLPEALKAAGVPIKQIGTSVDSLKGKALELNTELAKAQAAKFNDEALTSWQVYENQLNRINQAYATGKMSIQAYEAATLKASTNVATVWGMTAQSIVSPMASAFKTLGEMNKQYAGIAKVAAIGEALVNTYLAATKALASVPPPFNFAAAAAVTAAGLVNVAKIVATNFAHGGSFRVGGTGGTDSQPVSFMATPGEMVDVRTPGSARSDGGNVINLTIHGDTITKNQAREIFATINEGIRDGYRINLAA